ncbi:hypothetical protein JNW90_13280 [Micromonospora sp. STR1s_5]|nr:hypothetical protein [Micromonospora sp. STR1s_5]
MAVLPALTGPAVAVTRLCQAETKAWRSGEVIGAASACGVPESRLLAVGRTTIGLIREVARSSAEVERARRLHEQVVNRTAERLRYQQSECPAAIEAFEWAERN